MSENWFELAIIVFILLGIGAAIWKGGAANPTGTGSLGRKITKLENKVTSLSGKVDKVEGSVAELEKDSAKAKDLTRLEAALDDIRAEVQHLSTAAAGREATLDHVKQQVDRLYDFIVNRGMTK